MNVKMNRKQIVSLHRKWVQHDQGMSYRAFRKSVQPMLLGDGAVMVNWSGMWLGILECGGCHS